MKLYEQGTVKVHIASLDRSSAPRHDLAAERRTATGLIGEIFPGGGGGYDHRSDGSPILEGAPGSISVSHCRRCVAVAVDDAGGEIGVDVESADRGAQLRRVSGRFLGDGEEQWGRSDARLLSAWSIKEALYKAARREGWALLSIPLPSDAEAFERGEACKVEAQGRRWRVVKAGEPEGCGPVVLVTGV